MQTLSYESRQQELEGSSIWQSAWMNLLGRFVALVVVFGFFAILVPEWRFCTLRNLENLARQSAVYATAGLGMTFIIIAAGIDLSVGSIIALSVVMTAFVLNLNYEIGDKTYYYIRQSPYDVLLPIAAVAAAVALSTLAGMFNGVLIVGLRLVPFIITLGTMMVFRGVAKGITGEVDIYPEVTSWIKNIMDPTLVSPDPARRWMILPPGVWILVVAATLAALMLRYTRLGRHIFAVGSNEETARLCGVQVARTKIIVYTLAGFFGGLAGLMEYSFNGGIGQPTAGISYELFVIAAVVIGGGSFMGGEGSILGTLIGALIITILYSGGQQMGWPKYVQEIVIGSIIIAAVALDRLQHRKAT